MNRYKRCKKLIIMVLILFVLSFLFYSVKKQHFTSVTKHQQSNVINSNYVEKWKRLDDIISLIPKDVCQSHLPDKQHSYIYTEFSSIKWNQTSSNDKFAFATMLTNNADTYIEMARTLLHSYKEVVQLKVDFIVIIFKGKNISETNKCLLKQVGWKVIEVDRILAYKEFNLGPNVGQFTKIVLASLVQYDRIVYLDADTLVMKNIDELYFLPSDLAAVSDFQIDGQITTYINCGLLVIRPSMCLYYSMLVNLKTYEYGVYAEQDYFNSLLEFDIIRLPLIYNANIHMEETNKELWDKLKMTERMKIIHFTTAKPFWSQHQFLSIWDFKHATMRKMYNASECS